MATQLLQMKAMIAYFDLPISWKELAQRTWNEIMEDDVLSLAAQQAYYFFFALFPALLTLIAIASFFPTANLTDEVFKSVGRFAPPEALTLVTDQLRQISDNNHGGLLTFAFLLTLWSSSGAMVSIITTLNAAYDITEGRSWVRVRLTAILLTLGMALFILVSATLILVGPAIAERLADVFHLGPAFAWTWKILQWPVVFMLVATGIGVIYYFAPDAEQEWVWLTPGAVLATLLWMIGSLVLKYYLTQFADFAATYGAIGGVMAVLTWFYVTAITILIGAEVNAEIEHASPYGKDPGEKVPGMRKKIGLAARRAFEAQKSQFGTSTRLD
jgi:membrane protein